MLIAAAAAPTAAQTAAPGELFEVSGFFPVTIGGQTVRLEGMLIKKADAQGRMPVAIFTNGGVTTTAGLNNSKDFARNARDLARRGWLAIVVMRRGYGQSEGAGPTPLQCSAAAFKDWTTAAADDLAATMSYIAQRPDADPNRVMVIGPESGGAAAVALSVRNPAGLVAVVSIAGVVLSADRPCAIADILDQAYREFGKGNRAAHLWVYAKGDKLIDRELTERMHAAFLDAGGDVKFVEFHSWGNVDGDLFRRSRHQWMLQLDGFLRARKLPTVSVEDVRAIAYRLGLKEPHADQKVEDLFENYVPRGGEIAMAYSPSKHKENPSYAPTWFFQGATLEEARKAAIDSCKRFHQDCVIVMENLRWVGPKN